MSRLAAVGALLLALLAVAGAEHPPDAPIKITVANIDSTLASMDPTHFMLIEMFACAPSGQSSAGGRRLRDRPNSQPPPCS
jgi:hypothetical protein